MFMTAMWAAGLIPGAAFAAFLGLAFAMGFLLSMTALLLEELSFHMYPRLSQLAGLVATAVIENLGYRQLVAVWRLIGLVRWMRGKDARTIA